MHVTIALTWLRHKPRNCASRRGYIVLPALKITNKLKKNYLPRNINLRVKPSIWFYLPDWLLSTFEIPPSLKFWKPFFFIIKVEDNLFCIQKCSVLIFEFSTSTQFFPLSGTYFIPFLVMRMLYVFTFFNLTLPSYAILLPLGLIYSTCTSPVNSHFQRGRP